jgi:hypothetical protein
MLLRTAFAAGATTALVGAAAFAAAPAGATAPTTSGAAAVKVAPLKGYRTVIGSPVTVGAQTQGRATVRCPIGTVPLGGGVVVLSSDLHISVNSSFPAQGMWFADVNNASANDTMIRATVICATKPAGYKVVQREVENPAATHTTVAANCPTGTKPLGGGAASNSESFFVNLSSTAPTGTRAWQISENNATGTDHLVTVVAVCGSVKGYTAVRGGAVPVAGGTTAGVGANCPTNRVATGGGAVISSTSLGAYLNMTTFGDSRDWVSFATNTTASTINASTTVVCATALE